MYSEPNMSDSTLLMSVEDIISRAMGPPDVNIVNFKLIQMVLQILAQQQRMLNQRVEIKVTELAAAATAPQKSQEVSTESTSTKSPRPLEKRRMEEIKEERENEEKAARLRQKEKEEQKEKERAEKFRLKEKEKAERMSQKEQEKAQKLSQKEQEKAQKLVQREQEKAEKAVIKEHDKAEKHALKEQDKAEKLTQKEQEKSGKRAQKEQEKAEKAATKEHEKTEKAAMKEQEKTEKAAMREHEKTEKATMREQEKSEKAAMKDQEKAEKTALKEKEKAQKGQEKAEKRDQLEKEKAEKQALKDKEKMEKMTEKEKEKYLKEQEKIQKEALKAEKEAEKEKKRSAKEQEKAEKEKKKAEKEEERERSRSKSPAKKKKGDKGMKITETMRGKESVIVVEKGPTTRSESRSPANIDVVTQSQFALLEAAVMQLKEVAVPKPLEMPDNEKLRSDLVKGTASLPDTMQAMQVGARVKAAETAIDRMTGLLTQLVAAGDLKDDLADQLESTVTEQDRPKPLVAAKKSVMIDPKISQASHLAIRPSVASHLDAQSSSPSSVAIPRPSQIIMPRPSMMSRQSTISMGPGVTHEEMNSALKDLREEMSKNLQGVVTRAVTAADSALHTATNVANKLDVALKLDIRISSLFTLVSDYAEQLSGFDAGLTTQMQSFKDQIGQMRTDLQSGLAQLENVNNNAETAAVMELTERYTELVGDLDTTLSAHNSLQRLQGELGNEMHSLVECVEMLREQKCDRDEVLDGLRDKADISRLSGLLSEVKFAAARADFERRLDLCHEKFRRQDGTWTMAIKDLTRLTDQKAELVEMLSLRDLAQKQLQELHDRLRVLALALGEPKAALLTRLISRGATCGACGATALMEPQDASTGAPPRLPPLRRVPVPEPCARWVTAEPPLDRHTCHRWVGGSHTLVHAGTTGARESTISTPATLDQLTHKYTGYGDDGRLYMLEEDLKPCIECNMLGTSECSQPAAEGGGDGGTGGAQDLPPGQ